MKQFLNKLFIQSLELFQKKIKKFNQIQVQITLLINMIPSGDLNKNKNVKLFGRLILPIKIWMIP
jgi:hypothetical protein